MIFTSMFAYAFSRPYLRFKKCYAALGFMSMYISGGIVATFLLLSKMGLYNTYWVYIIPSLFGGFYNVIIYTSNFRGIPDELLNRLSWMAPANTGYSSRLCCRCPRR